MTNTKKYTQQEILEEFKKWLDYRENDRKSTEFEIIRTTTKKIETKDIQLGDKIVVRLSDGLGTHTATAHKITNDGVMFVFDSCVTTKAMNNENDTNIGGYDSSDLKIWIDTELFRAFPENLKRYMMDLRIPTVGEILGWEDDWDEEHFIYDNDEQLPLMRNVKYRISTYGSYLSTYWLKNATKENFSAAYFAVMRGYGFAHYNGASYSYGVRPVFWLVK